MMESILSHTKKNVLYLFENLEKEKNDLNKQGMETKLRPLPRVEIEKITYRRRRRQQRNERSLHNILVDTHAPHALVRAGGRTFYIRRGLDARVLRAHGVFLVVGDIEVDA